MMKKKVISLVLLTSLILGLAGCKKPLPEETVPGEVTEESTGQEGAEQGAAEEAAGEEEQAAELVPEEGAELLFWTADVKYGQKVAELFQEKTGIAVTVEEVGLDAGQKVSLDGPAGTGADVFITPHDMLVNYISSGLAYELEPAIAAQVDQAVSPVASKVVKKDGKMYGVPVSIETTAMFYNKTLVETPAATFEQIIEESKSYNDAKSNKFWFLAPVATGSGGFAFVTMNDVALFGEDGTDNENPGFNSPGFEKGLETLASFKEVLQISSVDMAMSAQGFLEEAFKKNETAYYISGPWTVQGFKDSGTEFGICPFPTYEGKTLKPMAFIQAAVVSSYSEYPIAAQMFAEYLTSEEAATALYEQASKITSRQDISGVKGLAEDEHLSQFLVQFQNAVPMPTASRMSYYWSIADSVFGAVYDGQLTPAEGAKKAQDDFDALVASE